MSNQGSDTTILSVKLLANTLEGSISSLFLCDKIPV